MLGTFPTLQQRWYKPQGCPPVCSGHPLANGLLMACILHESSFQIESGYYNVKDALTGAGWGFGSADNSSVMTTAGEGCLINGGGSGVVIDMTHATNTPLRAGSTFAQWSMVLKIRNDNGDANYRKIAYVNNAGAYILRNTTAHYAFTGQNSAFDNTATPAVNGEVTTLIGTYNSGVACKLYKDGVLYENVVETGAVALGTGIKIGVGNSHFIGVVYHYYLYGRELTAGEVQWLTREPYAFLRPLPNPFVGRASVAATPFVVDRPRGDIRPFPFLPGSAPLPV